MGGMFGVLFGYGNRPMRALLASLFLIAAASFLNGVAYSKGQFAPNSDVVLTSEAWRTAVETEGADGYPLPIGLGTASAQDYEMFHPVLYGLDLFLPLDALGQEQAWRTTTGRGVLGGFGILQPVVFPDCRDCDCGCGGGGFDGACGAQGLRRRR